MVFVLFDEVHSFVVKGKERPNHVLHTKQTYLLVRKASLNLVGWNLTNLENMLLNLHSILPNCSLLVWSSIF